MDTLYLICLLVGGFFLLLSLFGGDADADADLDLDADGDFDLDADHDFDAQGAGLPAGVGAGPGLVDLLTIRALFLFAAFFGLTGLLLSWIDAGEPFTAVVAVLTGLVVGLGGNYLIKRVGYAHVSSDVASSELRGITGKVLIPFEGAEKGKISLVAKGNRLQLVARSFAEAADTFRPGDEVVVVRMNGSVAEVVKPN